MASNAISRTAHDLRRTQHPISESMCPMRVNINTSVSKNGLTQVSWHVQSPSAPQGQLKTDGNLQLHSPVPAVLAAAVALPLICTHVMAPGHGGSPFASCTGKPGARSHLQSNAHRWQVDVVFACSSSGGSCYAVPSSSQPDLNLHHRLARIAMMQLRRHVCTFNAIHKKDI